MIILDSRQALVLARWHGEGLRAEAAAERLLGSARHDRLLAASLRWIADHLDPVPVAPRPAGQA